MNRRFQNGLDTALNRAKERLAYQSNAWGESHSLSIYLVRNYYFYSGTYLACGNITVRPERQGGFNYVEQWMREFAKELEVNGTAFYTVINPHLRDALWRRGYIKPYDEGTTWKKDL